MSLSETGAANLQSLTLFEAADDAAPSADGEMTTLIDAYDWAKTPIGPAKSWSQSLRMMVSFMLSNRFPLLLWWGPKYISIYNDAYRPILGAKHPVALGRPVSEVWSEIWDVLKPLIDAPFEGGPSTWMDDIELYLNRHGFLEETHFTVAYSPVPDEMAQGGIGGVLATVHEISEKVIGERRLAILRDLGSRAGDAKTAEEACELAAKVLSQYTKDVPFALLHLLDDENGQSRLAAAAGPHGGGLPSGVSSEASSVAGPVAELLSRQEMIVIDDVQAHFPEVSTGPLDEPPQTAVMLPLRSSKPGILSGFLVAGASSRLRLDHQYRGFFELMAAQIATSVANARAYEEERKRAESLAEIDRAKTVFFSNVSHEFRTPLTLMLGPLEQALGADPATLPQRRGDLEMAHRSGLRLLRLVNTLLDFSRIEAGRVQAAYEPVDLAAFTSGLADEFRAAMEKAGLQLIVDCPPLHSPVWVDRDMWEKIVLNLVSNAFKFTLKGTVTVRLRAERNRARLDVKDTGIGIPEGELPRIFERFHRVEGARGRSHEGTGIGLALVHELAKLHGGSAEVESKLDEGSTFTIRIPFGSAHLPIERLKATRTLQPTVIGVQPYVEEALRWLSKDGSQAGREDVDLPVSNDRFAAAEPSGDEAGEGERGTVLIVDDNADMRAHLARLLAPSYDIQTAADGLEALRSIRRQLPDILLSDVMMPRIDGVALLKEIRSDPALARLPVVLLSARAGDEARVEGLEAGADDYLTKPFGARELLARIATNLKLARLRRRYEMVIESDVRAMRRLQEIGNRCVRAGEDFDECLAEILDAAIDLAGADKGNIQLADHQGSLRIAAQRGFDDPFLSFFATVKSGEASSCSAALASAERIIVEDVTSSPVFRGDPALDVLLRSGVRAVISTPLTSSTGAVLGMISTHFSGPHRPSERELSFIDLLARQTADYLERRGAEAALRASESQLRAYVAASFDVVYRMNHDWGVMRYLDGKEFIADTLEPSTGWLQKYIHPDEQPRVLKAIDQAIRTKGVFELEHRVLRADGTPGWTFSRAIPLLDSEGNVTEWLGAATDITLRKQHEEHQRLLIDELNHRVKNTLATIQSLAMQTFRDTEQVEQAREQFVVRLLALAKAHDILTRENWRGAPLNEIVDGAIAAYRSIARDRFELDGVPVSLVAKQALALSMALHELCTNAVKYGALSNDKGRVRIQWSVSGLNGSSVLKMQWLETGGPPVTKPQRIGFGSRLIERGLSRDLRGNARLEFDVDGLRCIIETPLDQQASGMAVTAEP